MGPCLFTPFIPLDIAAPTGNAWAPCFYVTPQDALRATPCVSAGPWLRCFPRLQALWLLQARPDNGRLSSAIALAGSLSDWWAVYRRQWCVTWRRKNSP